MVRHKRIQQLRGGKYLNNGETFIRKHAFYEEFTFSWSEITSEQVEKSIFASYYIPMSSLSVQVIRDHLPDHILSWHMTKKCRYMKTMNAMWGFHRSFSDCK